jgi:pyruvate dehydrogenase E1 component
MSALRIQPLLHPFTALCSHRAVPLALIATLLGALSPTAGLITVIDGSPGTLSWIGGVRGNRVSPLGIDRFGQTGDLPDLYREYRLDAQAIVDATAELFL